MLTCNKQIKKYSKNDLNNSITKYYFLRILEKDAEKMGFLPPKNQENKELPNQVLINIDLTSKKIKNYCDTNISGQKLEHHDYASKQQYIYFLRLNSVEKFNNLYVFRSETGILPKIGDINLANTIRAEGITRHHILESEQYLEFMHGKQKQRHYGDACGNHAHINLSDDLAWAPGNLLLGPTPELNYHDGTKSGKGEKGFFKKNIKICSEIAKTPVTDKQRIEAWIFGPKIRCSPGANKNREIIKNCFNIYGKYKESSQQNGESANQSKALATHFMNTWSELRDRKMMVGVWSPVMTYGTDNQLSTKLKCVALLDYNDGIVSDLSRS